MSAICGILGYPGHSLQLDSLARMMQLLAHHGPDGAGSWNDGCAALGHQMMHTTPESLSERLPLHHGAAAIALTSDARLDNRDELLRALRLQRDPPVTDGELLVAAFLKWGVASLDRLVGEFAFALWDARTRTLHCCTDPMGIRPLYYIDRPGKCFAFASEVEALRGIAGAEARLSDRRLAMLGVSAHSVYLEPEATCFNNVRRVPPASVLSFASGRIRRFAYWAPDPGQRLRFRSAEECSDAFREVFSAALRPRLRSAFPIASLLSGGLDSSAITASASRQLAEQGKGLVTLTAVPEAAYEDQVTHERRYAELFASRPNLDMRWVDAAEAGPLDDLERLVATASLCSYSYQHFLYSALAREARAQDARVILDGDGGELSASCDPRGYAAELLLTGRWKRLAGELGTQGHSGSQRLTVFKRQVLRPLLPRALHEWIGRANRIGRLAPYPLREEFVRDTLGADRDRLVKEILRLPSEYPAHRRNQAHDVLLERNDLRQRSHAGFLGYHTVQFSYPFLDRRVIEFALAADGWFKKRHGQSRLLLRDGMAGIVPSEILQRTDKAPFSPDYLFRYRRQKDLIFKTLQTFLATAGFGDIVDFEAAFAALEKFPAYDPNRPMRVDYAAQCTVPYALFVCYFLEGLGNWGQRASVNQ